MSSFQAVLRLVLMTLVALAPTASMARGLTAGDDGAAARPPVVRLTDDAPVTPPGETPAPAATETSVDVIDDAVDDADPSETTDSPGILTTVAAAEPCRASYDAPPSAVRVAPAPASAPAHQRGPPAPFSLR